MTICNKCKQDTSDASVETCTGKTDIRYPDGTVLAPLRYDPRPLHLPHWFRCPDCNVVPGGYHHANCDQESCPKCGAQIISCDCFDGGV